MKNVSLVISLSSVDWSRDDFVFATARVIDGPACIKNRSICIKGTLPNHNIGTCYECIASLGVDNRGGDQWKITNPIETIPRDKLGIIRYLQLEGLPFDVANAFVNEHGEDVPRLLDEGTPMDLADIPQEFVNKWRERNGIMKLLRSIPGFCNKIITGIIDKFGSVPVVQCEAEKDPYVLMHAPCVSFAMADAVAMKMGISKDDPRRLRAATAETLKKTEGDGHTWMPKDDLLDATGNMLGFSPLKVQDALLQPTDDAMVVFDKLGVCYRAETLRKEQGVADGLNRLRVAPSPMTSKIDQIDYDAVFSSAPFPPTEEQQNAVRHILANKVSILTGGPGIGKSSIVKIVLDALASVQIQHIRLCAPTGKAAKRLSDTSGMTATTIHRLVPQLQDPEKIPPSFVIIDEMSMVDTFIAEWLINALPDECHLLLVGDVNQLPSIGPGMVLHDCITAGVPATTLTQVMRQGGESGILKAVYAMNHGDVVAGGYPDYHYFETTRPDEVVNRVMWLVTQGIPQMYGIPSNEIRVIAPQKSKDITKGCGVNRLNVALQEALNPASFHKNEVRWYDTTLREGDLLIWTENNYMTRRLTFTAMSRAQKLLVIVGEKRALERAARNTREEQRRTGLVDRIIKGENI